MVSSDSKRQSLVFLFAISGVIALLQIFVYDMADPELDAIRYVDYGLNIHDHAVFGLSGDQRGSVPAHGNANSPLYPGLIALAIGIDNKLGDTLRCIMSRPGRADQCERNYLSIRIIQSILIIAALFALWSCTRLIFNANLIAWLACAIVLLSTKPLFFTNLFLTEILILFLFAILLLVFVLAIQQQKARWWALLGLVIALMTLTRPEYLYLGYVFIALGVLNVLRERNRHALKFLVAFIICFLLALSPWLARNKYHFDSAAITGGYGDAILAYRLAYNRMSFAEWRAAFIYWLPGYGEQLAQKLLAPSSYRKLGTDPRSYLYDDGEEIFNQGLIAVQGDRHKLTTYLIKTEIMDHPFRHAYASLPLAWRGILAGKYLAIIGLPSLVFMLLWAMLKRNWVLFALMLPAFVMIAIYAAVSVSIPRYNIYLIYYYGIASAWLLVRSRDRLLMRLGRRQHDEAGVL